LESHEETGNLWLHEAKQGDKYFSPWLRSWKKICIRTTKGNPATGAVERREMRDGKFKAIRCVAQSRPPLPL